MPIEKGALAPEAKPEPPNKTPDHVASKPRVAYLIATSFGLGYLPKAPGTWGSLFGVLLGWLAMASSVYAARSDSAGGYITNSWETFAALDLALIVIVSLAGVRAADRVAAHLRSDDPQIVVIDEVAGQLIAYLALATPATFAVSWKYLLAGFILFRGFDIWKPFPARQAESLPGGLGIMADDWIAGAYAALVLLIARRFGF
jgi:phosphatidylglycerophosphatase A